MEKKYYTIDYTIVNHHKIVREAKDEAEANRYAEQMLCWPEFLLELEHGLSLDIRNTTWEIKDGKDIFEKE